jgi:hypothetical protein
MSRKRTIIGALDRLELAKRVWSAAGPDDEEVNRAVARIGRAMRASVTPRPRRRMTLMAVAFTAMLAAFAYAKGGGFRSEGVREPGADRARLGPSVPRRAVPEVVEPLRVDGLPDNVPASEAPAVRAPSSPTTPSSPTAPSPATPPAPLPKNEGAKHRSAAREAPLAPEAEAAPWGTAVREGEAATSHTEASWRAVSQALQAGDQAGAERLLKVLADTGADAATRGKATLGLAQMYQAQGACERVPALAAKVESMPGVDAKTVLRAQALAARCAAR